MSIAAQTAGFFGNFSFVSKISWLISMMSRPEDTGDFFLAALLRSTSNVSLVTYSLGHPAPYSCRSIFECDLYKRVDHFINGFECNGIWLRVYEVGLPGSNLYDPHFFVFDFLINFSNTGTRASTPSSNGRITGDTKLSFIGSSFRPRLFRRDLLCVDAHATVGAPYILLKQSLLSVRDRCVVVEIFIICSVEDCVEARRHRHSPTPATQPRRGHSDFAVMTALR